MTAGEATGRNVVCSLTQPTRMKVRTTIIHFVILQRFSSMFPFPNRDASVHRDWPADVRYVAAEDGARIAEKGELGVALGNDRPLAFIRVQILVKTTVNDKRQKARIPATKLQWLPARNAILTSGSGRTLDGRESLRAGRDAHCSTFAVPASCPVTGPECPYGPGRPDKCESTFSQLG